MHALVIKAIMQFYSDLAANIKVAVMSFCRVATRAFSDQIGGSLRPTGVSLLSKKKKTAQEASETLKTASKTVKMAPREPRMAPICLQEGP